MEGMRETRPTLAAGTGAALATGGSSPSVPSHSDPSKPPLTDMHFSIWRDNDDAGTFVTAHCTAQTDLLGAPLEVAHLHVPDENVGKAHWFAGDVYVMEALRRSGIATHLYALMEKHLNLPARRAAFQSAEGSAFWDAREAVPAKPLRRGL